MLPRRKARAAGEEVMSDQSTWDIARRFFSDVMEAEDENLGCLVVHQDRPDLAVMFCCQWNQRSGYEICGECARLERAIEAYAVRCIETALAVERKSHAEQLDKVLAGLAAERDDWREQIAAMKQALETIANGGPTTGQSTGPMKMYQAQALAKSALTQ